MYNVHQRSSALQKPILETMVPKNYRILILISYSFQNQTFFETSRNEKRCYDFYRSNTIINTSQDIDWYWRPGAKHCHPSQPPTTLCPLHSTATSLHWLSYCCLWAVCGQVSVCFVAEKFVLMWTIWLQNICSVAYLQKSFLESFNVI